MSTLAQAEVAPPDVYRAVMQLRGDLEMIRAVMGRPAAGEESWEVINAAPRHVFYQAQTLQRKANQLALEIADASRHAPAPAPAGEIVPGDVLRMVQDAHQYIRQVKVVLGIEAVTQAPVGELTGERTQQPRDVFRSILQAGRQLNRLLDRRVKPEHVYRRLELALSYALGMVADRGGRTDQSLPEFEGGKIPRDVYHEVLNCMEAAAAVGERDEITVLELDLNRERQRNDILPADVYDVATTLLSDLAYLSWHMEAAPRVPQLEPRDHIFPSHVLQIARMLTQQLAMLVAP